MVPPGVLCIHGLTGSPDELAPLEASVRTAGYQVRTPLLAGHGADADTLAATKWTDWLQSAQEALTQVCAQSDGRAVVIGSSVGGLLALRLARDNPGLVAGVVLLATPPNIGRASEAQIRLRLWVPARLRPRWFREITKPDGINVSDPALAAGLRSLSVYPLATLGQLLDLMADVEGRLSQVRQPVLAVHGALDTTVSRRQVDALLNRLTGAARIERLDLLASAHLVAIDHERHAVAARVLSFLRSV